jgi:DNA repair exonuclease SbcCD ATPase subunit
MTLEEIRTATSKAQGSRLHLSEALASRELQIARSLEDTAAFEDVQRLIQETAKEVQESIRFHIQDLVQHALDAIFPGTYKFLVEFTVSRGRTEARLLVEKGGNVMDDLMEDEGGTLVQIVAMALRIAVWTLAPTAPVLIFDEPGTAVSAQYKPIFAEVIRGLSQRLGVQILMVSHDDTYIATADRVFTVTQGPDGRSQVTYEDKAC